MSDLTPDERRAIASLKRLAKRWPKSLWLFSASGSLNVMRCGADGARVHHRHPDCGVDQSYSLTTVDLPNDGGDW